MSEDWLALDESKVPAWHHTKHPEKARKKYAPAVHDNSLDSKRKELVGIKRELPQPQRDYMECVARAGFHYGNAHREMVARGYLHDKSTYTRWRQKPRLARGLIIAEELAVAAAGVTAGKVLARVDALSEYGMDDFPVRDRDGNILVDKDGNELRMMRDPALALKANELLGKRHKLWGNDQEQVRVTVQIVDLAGDNAEPILDGEFAAVADDDN